MKPLPGILALALLVASCRRDMQDQPRYGTFQASAFFEDGRSARPLVLGTIARGHLDEDDHLHRGRIGDAWADTFPFPVTAEVLARGRERFDIFCAPCHGPEAKGGVTGPVATKFIPPPDLTNAELHRQRTDGYWHSYIMVGGAVMPAYGEALSSHEAWHVVNYLRSLVPTTPARTAKP